MATDGVPTPASNMPTPLYTPSGSGTSTPQIQTSTLGEYLAAPLGKKSSKSYLAGSKALDSLVRMIASTESFFHPSNSGAWTADVRTTYTFDYVCERCFDKACSSARLSSVLYSTSTSVSVLDH